MVVEVESVRLYSVVVVVAIAKQVCDRSGERRKEADRLLLGNQVASTALEGGGCNRVEFKEEAQVKSSQTHAAAAASSSSSSSSSSLPFFSPFELRLFKLNSGLLIPSLPSYLPNGSRGFHFHRELSI